ncbi:MULTISPECIES: hypothetical protein [unclassified Rhizobium]|uniref:hypothetical protein n=1 Tax=unclassified Rhizobium TaxID=2613769 RepID=UPI002478917C|nr:MULTISPECIES: hypothetical protein [unclassified Rhizobium]MDH7803332.1 hypothetical protein [Rhizobium sp. AN70]
MLAFISLRRGTLALCAAAAALHVGSAVAAETDPTFYDAALCNPPYTMTSATAVYDAAEKLAKPDTSSLGAAIYTLPFQIGRDGFESDQVFFANGAVGILIKGQRADALAAKYDLKPETSDLMGTSSKGYARALSQDLQPPEGLAGPGKVSIVAREGDALGDKTLLACEFAAD